MRLASSCTSFTRSVLASTQPPQMPYGIPRERSSWNAVPRERAQIPGTGQVSSAQAVGSNTMRIFQLSLPLLVMAGVVSSATSQQQNAQSGEPAQLVQARADLAAAEA